MTTAADFVRLVLAQEGDEYVFGAEVSKADPDPDRFDCSELIEWACGWLGVVPTMPDGSWLQARHCQTNDTLIPIDQGMKTRGALLFAFSSDPFVGGRPSSAHVVVSLGDGRTIEARSRTHGIGVFSAYNRGWTHAARVPGVTYPHERGPAPTTVARGDKGPLVEAIQRALKRWSERALPRFGVDSDFGPETEAWVVRYQSAVGLDPSGVVDALTAAFLLAT